MKIRHKRYPVMYNDFILVGPKSDPAGMKGSKDIVAAFKVIKDKSIPFTSRGDRSGTHLAELDLWRMLGSTSRRTRAPGTGRLGQGMGAALNSAVGFECLCTRRSRHLALVQKQG